ncbi:MAG: hypothetical protein ABIN96_02030 [Rubrivivax sp.]
MNKSLIATLVAAFTLVAGHAHAADACADKAAEKKLAGAAKTSFMKKCERDMAPPANAACTTAAADKKLAGAAKTSFVRKCEKDAMAAKG